MTTQTFTSPINRLNFPQCCPRSYRKRRHELNDNNVGSAAGAGIQSWPYTTYPAAYPATLTLGR